MQGTRILLLEDDRETRWALATVLRREGCRVTEAANGEEGLRFLARNPYDLCISDVCMPGMGGFGFFAAVRFPETPELAARRDVPIILLSGRVPTRELAQALDAGVDEFLEKPIDPEEFKARIRAVLRRSRATAAPQARTSGDLADFSMAGLTQALQLGGRTVRLRTQAGPVTATLDFHHGEIKHATLEAPGVVLQGDEAAVEALSLGHGSFEVVEAPDSVPHTVFADMATLLLRAAARTDEIANTAAPGAPAAESAPPADDAETVGDDVTPDPVPDAEAQPAEAPVPRAPKVGARTA